MVESPAKAKTIEKYLGKDYKVLASYGHVRDLIPKEGAIEPDNDFLMHYQSIDRNIRHVEMIAKTLKYCDALYLATDPDREGEAIAWHIKILLENRPALKSKKISRVVFHQITKDAVKKAMDNPRDIAMKLVHAQQARRALDFLVGFTLSPLLWKKIRARLSAGRVQSPALRMIVERDIEIENFKPQEYWTIHATTKADEKKFDARLTHFCKKKLEQFSITTEKQANNIIKKLIKIANSKLDVVKVSKKQRKRHPSAPFITSTLQQEAARKLGFSAQKTMKIAQQLYEGIDVGEGETGLITYMRTDSVTLAQEAMDKIRYCIVKQYGQENLPQHPRFYKKKSKNAQEAHEAIRPTFPMQLPNMIQSYLTNNQIKLYRLIWKRTMACQMIDAILHTVAVDLSAGDSIFRANGSTILKPGFIRVYQEDQDDKQEEDSPTTNSGKLLPMLQEGEQIFLESIRPQQHFTEPLPRYTEASLVKALEEHDIGRPSTYANIIATLKNRRYVDVDNKRFKATDVGHVVNRFLTNYFTKYVNYDFTAHLEDNLDGVARGDKAWVPLLKDFWHPFKSLIDQIQETVQRRDVTEEKLDEQCPECRSLLSIRLGKRGQFIGCTAYPDCDYTRNLRDNNNEEDFKKIEGRQCPKCSSDLLIRSGRYGKFIGCSGYRRCNYMESLEKPKNTQVLCPKCKKENIFQRKSRRGKIFYSCAGYPECKYALWDMPVSETCPSCQWPILTIKTTKKRGQEKLCTQTECDYLLPMSNKEEDKNYE